MNSPLLELKFYPKTPLVSELNKKDKIRSKIIYFKRYITVLAI